LLKGGKFRNTITGGEKSEIHCIEESPTERNRAQQDRAHEPFRFWIIKRKSRSASTNKVSSEFGVTREERLAI